MTPELIASIVAVLGALTAYLKAHSESADIVRSREATKQERDTRIALLETKVVELEHRLDAGSDRFDRIEKELKETNGLLRELLGMFKMTTRAAGHTPEER